MLLSHYARHFLIWFALYCMYCRYFSDICLYCLEVLQLITLSPLPRRAIYASSSGSGPAARSGSHPHSQQLRSGMAILLHAASTGNVTPFYGLADPEVRN
jgi:hypothetical protein